MQKLLTDSDAVHKLSFFLKANPYLFSGYLSWYNFCILERPIFCFTHVLLPHPTPLHSIILLSFSQFIFRLSSFFSPSGAVFFASVLYALDRPWALKSDSFKTAFNIKLSASNELCKALHLGTRKTVCHALFAVKVLWKAIWSIVSIIRSIFRSDSDPI